MNRILIYWILLFCFFSADTTSAQPYFQQEVNYRISVTLDDVQHTIRGNEEIVYKNNSTKTLTEIYFHLWPNAYKNENTVLAKTQFKRGQFLINDRDEENGFIDSLDFRINGSSAEWRLLKDTIDVAIIKLPSSLLPGQQITITTPFFVKLPSASISRLGHNGQAYFLTQWYPKPAVFDRTGWHYMPYLDMGEFYSEFGSFDVSITLPANYVVAATGELQDQKELEYLDSLDRSTRRIEQFQKNTDFPPSSAERKTLRFIQDNVHDFAWFADKRWHVLKDQFRLPSGRLVTSYSMFTNVEAEYWKQAPLYIKRSVLNFSKRIGDYPYAVVTAVDVNDASGNGMEYPMITPIGNYGDSAELEKTIAHEVAHNWFYGILGSNEREHAWMDEGMTQFYELTYIDMFYPANSRHRIDQLNLDLISYSNKLRNVNQWQRSYYIYALLARANYDMKPALSSEKYNYRNYRMTSYNKISVSFAHLRDYLGESLFDSCVQLYFAEWKFRHPSPADHRAVFERVSGKDLSWFYDGILNSTEKSDYGLCKLQARTDGKKQIKINKKGKLQQPISLSAFRNDSLIEQQWIQSASDTTVEITCANCTEFRLDAEKNSLDLNRSNNFLKSTGLLKRAESITFRLGTSVTEEEKRQIYYLPLVGGNAYNHLLVGAALHNVSVFQKKFEYVLMPMYGTRTGDLNGGGNLIYRFFPKGKVYQVNLSTGLSSYGTGDVFYGRETQRFIKSDNRINFLFLPQDRSGRKQTEIQLRHIYLEKTIPVEYRRGNSVALNFGEVTFSLTDPNPLKRSVSKLIAQGNKEYVRLSLELERFFNYGSEKKGLTTRFFAGWMSIDKNTTPTFDYRMRLSGRSGPDDYLFEEPFMGRGKMDDDFYSRQFLVTDAGFKSPTLFYRLADQWMTGLNLTTTLPGLIPFRLFYNVGTMNDAKTSYIDNRISWEGGIDLPLLKNVLTVYLPLFYSNDVKYVIEQSNWKRSDLIRFELRLNNLNPVQALRNAYKN